MRDASVDARVERIATKLRSVVRGGFQPFGAEDHGFRLRSLLTERQVAAFEARHAIELPLEYRSFITRVADGGAGPAYGMYSLEEALTNPWRGPVPDDFLSTPFPHADAYNPYQHSEVESFWQRVESGEVSETEAERRDLYQTAGTLVLCYEGCGYLHFLVVTGPARGQMWLDGRCSDQGFFPLGVGFLDWYERWLDSTLAGGRGPQAVAAQQESEKMTASRVTLDEADRAKLTEANRLLTELTEGHAHCCDCEICEARWRTEVQDAPECWTVPGVTWPDDLA